MSFKTEQEAFWSGHFGNDYVDRNNDANSIANNIVLFSEVLKNTSSIKSIMEFGGNIGLNIHALKTILPNAEFSTIEINKKAVGELNKIDGLKVYHQSILDYQIDDTFDLVFAKGVLIHLDPDVLKEVYDLMYHSSEKYILISEYYNPVPVEINYRGHNGKLFKRDFAGEFLDRFNNLELINYGFKYHRDNNYPQDDETWFLLKKH